MCIYPSTTEAISTQLVHVWLNICGVCEWRGVGVTKGMALGPVKRQFWNYLQGFEKYGLGIWLEIKYKLVFFKLLLAEEEELGLPNTLQ